MNAISNNGSYNKFLDNLQARSASEWFSKGERVIDTERTTRLRVELVSIAIAFMVADKNRTPDLIAHNNRA